MEISTVTQYHELRYVDLKQIVEAMISYYPCEATDENGSFHALLGEFNWLADELGYEDCDAMLDRLIANDDAEAETGEL